MGGRYLKENMSKSKRMKYEQLLEQRFPEVKWREPLPIIITRGKNDLIGFACRFCIAIEGFAPSKGNMKGFSATESDAREHISREHIMI